MTDPTPQDDLVARLLETEWSGKSSGRQVERDTTCWHRNPDGPEAAARIPTPPRIEEPKL